MKKLYLLALVVLVAGCAEPGRTSLVSSTAGGIMGAGLGAVIGNQVGSAGGGLLIGAVAGTSAGAAIGTSLEQQEDVARYQDEAIERHERIIQAQRSELVELRRMNQDSSFGDRQSASLRSGFAPSLDLRPNAEDRPGGIGEAVKRELDNQDELNSQVRMGAPAAPSVAARLPRPESVGGRWDQTSQEAEHAMARNPSTGVFDQCGKADQEIDKASAVSDSADKLFHLRRAIRLCPEQPRFRLALGDYYAANSRQSEAKVEYERAKKLSRDSSLAEDKISKLSRY